MRFLIAILAFILSSASAFEADEFAEAATERPHFFTAEGDLGMMSIFEGHAYVEGYNKNGTDGPYVPLNGSDIDGPYVPYEDDLDRGISTRVTCGSRRTIRSRTYPNNYPANEWEFWQFRVAPNVRFVLSCSSVHIPSPDNGLFFSVFQSSNLNVINTVVFNTGSTPQSRTFRRRDILSTEIKIFMTLIGSPSSSRTGTGLNCVVRGECTTNPPTTTPSPPTTTVAPPPGGLQCGQCAGSRSLSGSDRIVNGNFANNDKYCFMGRLHSAFRSPSSFFCGGTLVSPNTVVTAAHCVDNIGTASNLAVSFNCDLGTCSRTVRASRIAVHPSWNENRLCSGGNDIAVIRLSSSVPLSGSINFACLPAQGQCVGSNQIKQTAGYGRIFGGGPVSLRLKEANIRTESCGCSFTVTCAREVTGRTCNGDSGSFMGTQVNGRWRLEGVTSFGFENCPQNDRMGFTEVCNFVTNFIVPNSGGGTQING